MDSVVSILEDEIKQLKIQIEELHNDVFYKPYVGEISRGFQKSLEKYDRICSEYCQTLKILNKIKMLEADEE